MEVYILDTLYRRIEVVDRFESLIWSERFSSVGDFVLNVFSTLENRNRFVSGVLLATNVSYRVMMVETVTDTTDTEGRRILEVKGPSFESVLKQRMIAYDDAGLWIKYSVEGAPKDLATAMFHDICVTGILDAGDIIPSVTEGSIFPADTIEEPTDEVIYTPDIQDLYTALKNLCDAFAMGFRLVRDLDTSMLYFDVYLGSDRTTGQTTLPAVVFSPDLDNLRNTTLLKTNALYKNVAYVVNATLHELVYLDDVDPAIEGFERRVLVVIGDDDMDSTELIAKGKEELAKNRMITALDGELASSTSYVYGVDYNLGDMVELRDDDGATSLMQVTEQIFVSDKEGDRAYPTLSVNNFITPGSWLSWDAMVEWDELTTEHWDELP